MASAAARPSKSGATRQLVVARYDEDGMGDPFFPDSAGAYQRSMIKDQNIATVSISEF